MTREQQLDVAAIDMLAALFPDDVPTARELRWRLADVPLHDVSRRAYLAIYIERVEALEARAA